MAYLKNTLKYGLLCLVFIAISLMLINGEKEGCFSNRLYLNLFVVKIKRSSRLHEIRAGLARNGFQYLGKITTSYHSFKLKKNLKEIHCAINLEWLKRLNSLSITTSYHSFKLKKNLKEIHCAINLEWLKRLNSLSKYFTIYQDFRTLNKYNHRKLFGGKKPNSIIYGKLWSKEYSSSGVLGRRNEAPRVKIIVSDNGFDLQHPNLINKINSALSWDFLHGDPDPEVNTRSYLDQVLASHGTMAMGKIGAEKLRENNCDEGLCSNCELIGLQLQDDYSGPSDTAEAKALSYLKQSAPVYSASYGIQDNRGFLEIRRAANGALRDGVEHGRQCKGRIYVYPSGNGDRDNCNMDGYANSIYTITIAEVTESLLLPQYSERCPCIMAAAIVNTQTYTTAIKGSCINGMTGSSFAVPVASSCISEIVDLNPDLSERDVKHIIVNSVRTRGLDTKIQWRPNGAGRQYNDRVGFGVLDCPRMTGLAAEWNFVPQQIRCIRTANENSFNVDLSCNINYIEHVQVEIKMCCNFCRESDFGEVQIELRSPAGTISAIMTPSRIEYIDEDMLRNRCKKWTFMSVQFWGEKSQGDWRVTWQSNYYNVSMTPISIILHGTKDNPLTSTNSPKSCIQPTERDNQHGPKILILDIILGVFMIIVANILCVVIGVIFYQRTRDNFPPVF